MDGERKYTKERVRLAAERLLSPLANNKPKYSLSERRIRVKFINMILRNSHFSPKSSKLLKALAKKDTIDSSDIKIETESIAPRGLVRDTRKKIKSSQYLKDTFDIGSLRQGRKWIYFIKVVLPS